MLTEQKKLIPHKTPRNVSSSLWHLEKAKMRIIQYKSLHNNRRREKSERRKTMVGKKSEIQKKKDREKD